MGVITPLIYSVDLESTAIIMEYVSGDRLKDVLDDLKSSRLYQISKRLGILVGRLHQGGIVHGDLTTSNMIITGDNELCLLDFGLGEHSMSLETRGVDLHILRTILFSTHHSVAGSCFEWVVDGYREELGLQEANSVLKRTEEIGRRGRYVKVR